MEACGENQSGHAAYLERRLLLNARSCRAGNGSLQGRPHGADFAVDLAVGEDSLEGFRGTFFTVSFGVCDLTNVPMRTAW